MGKLAGDVCVTSASLISESRNGNRKKPVKKLVKIWKFVDNVGNRNRNSREFAASGYFRPKPRSLVETCMEERGRGPSGEWHLTLKPRDFGYT